MLIDIQDDAGNDVAARLGILGAVGPIANIDAAAWDRTIAVRLSSSFYGTKHAARVTIEHGGGPIINICLGPTSILMSKGKRRRAVHRRLLELVQHMQVAVAQPGGAYLDEHLTRTGLRNGNLLVLGRRLPGNHSVRLHPCPPRWCCCNHHMGCGFARPSLRPPSARHPLRYHAHRERGPIETDSTNTWNESRRDRSRPVSLIAVEAALVVVDPSQRNAIVAASAPIQAATRRDESGCRVYSFAADAVEPDLIQVYELWDDEESLAAHFLHPNYAAMRDLLHAAGLKSTVSRKLRIDATAPVYAPDRSPSAGFPDA